jgi:hypothetical protein
MIEHPAYHLTPDDLDAWLEGRLSAGRTSHLETCSECLELARSEREIVDQLKSLPHLSPALHFADRVIAGAFRPTAVAGEHFGADDLEAWITGELGPSRRAHLTACRDCQALADAERVLVARLAALPLLDPAPGFADRVMPEVRVPAFAGAISGWRTRIFATRRATAIAAGVAMALLGSMGGSVAWSLDHRATLVSIGDWALREGGQLFWVGLRGAVSNLIEQPWYQGLSSLSAGWVAALSATAAASYVGGIIALRRLLTVPPSQVARA